MIQVELKDLQASMGDTLVPLEIDPTVETKSELQDESTLLGRALERSVQDLIVLLK